MAANTKDKVQAHRFMIKRVRTALLEGDAESNDRPLARLGTGTYVGIILTVIMLSVVGLIGLLVPGGSKAWQVPGAFIVEKETGARYVYLNETLYPVLNYSSAKLLLGSTLTVVTVSVRSLAGVSHGPAIGIANAPDSLPDAAHITPSPWSVCATGHPESETPFATGIFPGLSLSGASIPPTGGYLVLTPPGGHFLIWNNHAFEIPQKWLAAIGYTNTPNISVGEDFVASLPTGQQIVPLAIPGLGEAGPLLPNSVQKSTVGAIYTAPSNTSYVMTRSGLAAMTPLQSKLLLADPATAAAYSGSSPAALPISAAQLTGAALASLPAPSAAQAAPQTAPPIVQMPSGATQLCVRYPGTSTSAADIVIGPPSSANAASAANAVGSVQLPTGTGALIIVQPNPQTKGTTVFLVSDTGVRYPLAPKALEQLGLGSAPLATLPPAVVALLPEGPLLDPARALQPPAKP